MEGKGGDGGERGRWSIRGREGVEEKVREMTEDRRDARRKGEDKGWGGEIG